MKTNFIAKFDNDAGEWLGFPRVHRIWAARMQPIDGLLLLFIDKFNL